MLMISIRLMAMLEDGLLEKKMTDDSYQDLLTSEAAEVGLLIGEAHIRGQVLSVPGMIANIHYRLNLLEVDACLKKRYRIIATADYQHHRVKLSSQYDYLASSPRRSCQKEIGAHRLDWERL